MEALYLNSSVLKWSHTRC